MIDVNEAFREYLARDGRLRDLVAERIFAGRDVPPPGHKPEDGAAITFRVRGGTSDEEFAILKPSFQVKCYAGENGDGGPTEKGAYDVYRRFWEYITFPGGDRRVISVDPEVAGQSLEEPTTGWPFTLCYVVALIRNLE